MTFEQVMSLLNFAAVVAIAWVQIKENLRHRKEDKFSGIIKEINQDAIEQKLMILSATFEQRLNIIRDLSECMSKNLVYIENNRLTKSVVQELQILTKANKHRFPDYVQNALNNFEEQLRKIETKHNRKVNDDLETATTLFNDVCKEFDKFIKEEQAKIDEIRRLMIIELYKSDYEEKQARKNKRKNKN